MPSLLRVFASLQREITVKDELAEGYVSDANELRKAYSEMKQEREGLVRACKEVEHLLAGRGKADEYRSIVARFGGLEISPGHAHAARRLEEIPDAVRAALEKLSE